MNSGKLTEQQLVINKYKESQQKKKKENQQRRPLFKGIFRHNDSDSTCRRTQYYNFSPSMAAYALTLLEFMANSLIFSTGTGKKK
jgi:hypothetical protein